MTHFITAEQLQRELGKVVVFDCRFNLQNKTLGAEQYSSGHIPGAYYLDLEKNLSGPAKQHGGRHPLPDPTELTQTLKNSGVNKRTTVVVYDDSRMAYAARAWWLLRYYGHQNVLILDGGFSSWVATGGNLDKRTPTQKSGTFSPKINTSLMVNRNTIIEQKEHYTLIDSREAKRYRGEEEPIDPIAGHIPGALNFNWQDVTNEQGFIKPESEQRARWQEITHDSEIIVYCGSGVTACVNILSLEISGINAKLYPGSWSDWCSYM